MARADIRQHPGVALAAAVAIHLVVISLQVTTQTGVTMFTAVVFGGVANVQRATAGVTGGVRSVWNGYFALRGVRAANVALRTEIGALQVALQQERAAADRADALRRLLEFRARSPLLTTGAEVIGSAASPDFRTITIDKGERDGLRANMAVMAPAGIVGRIIRPGARAALVQLLIDRNAAAGALITRTRVQGIVVGLGEDLLAMDFVAATGDVAVGDEVVTSGIDGLYPKGLTVGTVDRVEPGGGLYQVISVRPAVDFARLEELLVVLGLPGAAAEVPQP